MDARKQQLENWLSSQGVEYQTIEPASADASFRRYFRISGVKANLHPEGNTLNSLVVMDAPPEKEDCQAFIKVASLLLEAGLNVPVIYLQDLQQGFLVLSDLGNDMMLYSLNNDSVEQMYAAAIKQIILMQKNARAELPGYNQQRLQDEMMLFPEWYVPYYLETGLNQDQSKVLQQTFALLVENALQQPQAFVHRDYHSRNLMINKADPGFPGVIDFQDAVNGPVTYDLVSLLKDCYICWPREKVESWVKLYLDQATEAGIIKDVDFQTFLKWFDLMGLQRHIKVAGIFTRLKRRDGKTGYMKDIPRVMDYIHEVKGMYPELAAFAGLIDELEKSSPRQQVD